MVQNKHLWYFKWRAVWFENAAKATLDNTVRMSKCIACFITIRFILI